MKHLSVIATLFAVAMLGDGARATDYVTNPNPACTLRYNVPGATHLVEPNLPDAKTAAQLAGSGERSGIDHAPEIRRRFAVAFPLLQKIDTEGTTALSALPLTTPRIDGLIDRTLINLIWARSMLAIFYEEGRAPPIDYAKAGEFYRKSAETQFTDDRGCVHSWPPAPAVLLHLAGYYAYGVGVPHDPAKARELLQRAGVTAKPVLALLEHNSLPRDIEAYLDALNDPGRLADRAYGVEHPPGPGDMPSLMTWVARPDLATAAVAAPFWTALDWAGLVVAALILVVVALWLLGRWRGRLEQRAPAYRTAFAVYDVLQRTFSRIGLLAGGLVGCGVGVWMLLQGTLFGFEGPLRLVVLFGGVAALLGGIAKLAEAARVGQKPANNSVHGAARPAEESEAEAAARGDAKKPDLSDRTFKD